MEKTELDNLIVVTWRLADIGSDIFEILTLKLNNIQEYNQAFFKLITCERILIAFTCSTSFESACMNCKLSSKNSCMANELLSINEELSQKKGKTFTGKEAFRYLCIVASSLDSSTLGEPEILGQFKKAIKEQKEKNNLNPSLEELIIFAYKAGKKVHTSSDIPKGRISILSNAESIFNDWVDANQKSSKLNLAIVGTGKMGLDANKYFVNKNVNISIYSRNRKNTNNTINNICINSFDDFDINKEKVDVLVLCSSTVEPFMTKSYITANLKSSRKLLVFDLGVPRNSSTDLNDLEHVSLYQMEHLIALADDNKKQRESLVPIAYKIINQQVTNVVRFFEKRKISPLIKDLRIDLQRVAEKRLSSYSQKDIPNDFYRWFNNTIKELMHVSQQHLEASLTGVETDDDI